MVISFTLYQTIFLFDFLTGLTKWLFLFFRSIFIMSKSYVKVASRVYFAKS